MEDFKSYPSSTYLILLSELFTLLIEQVFMKYHIPSSYIFININSYVDNPVRYMISLILHGRKQGQSVM